MNPIIRYAHRAILLAALGSIGVPAVAAPADGDAGLPGAFLTYGAGARALGMGRAFTALADDGTAVYWNPGGLAHVSQNHATLQHVSLIDGNAFQYLGYTHIFPYIGTLGAAVVMLNQGAAEGRNTYNEPTGDFTNRELGVLLGFGTDVTPTLAAGGTAKIVNQSMLEYSGTGFGLDLGLMYHPFPMLTAGLVFKNLVAPKITLKEDPDTYPMELTLGVSARFLDNMLRADVDVAKNLEQEAVEPRFGVEAVPMQNLFIRAGLDSTEITLGAGYRYTDFQLDYAVGLQTIDMLHKVSLSYIFGGFVLKVEPDPETFSPVGIKRVSVLKIHCQTKFEVRLWSLEVFNEANAMVKRYSGQGFPPDHIVWDGLLDSTLPMPDGRYRVVLSLEDAAGETKRSADAFVNIQSVLPLGVSPVEILE